MNYISVLKFVSGIFFAFLLITFSTFLYLNIVIVTSHKMNTTLEIGSEVGINLDTDALHFGTIRNTGTSQRSVNLNPSENYILIKVQGNISEFLYTKDKISKNPQKITFEVYVNESNYGYYEGQIMIYELRNKNRLLNLLLPGKTVVKNPNERPSSVLINIER